MLITRQFRQDQSGATIIEFAVIAPVFFFLMFIIIELGLMLFSQVALESATMQVSRSASVCNSGGNGGGDCASLVRQLVQQRTRGLINSENITVSANTLANGGAARAPELCLTNPPSSPPVCPDRYEDRNGNGRYDGPGTVSTGNAGDLVEIRVSYPWRMLIPGIERLIVDSGKLYGNDDNVLMLSASTIIKNEPQ